ncbi:MAG: hypothetical protein PHX78_07540 [bacterium]|nr:hypothetical protein [bacterium]
MDKFETLFGLKRPDIKENCILMPLISKYILQAFDTPNLTKGKIYSSVNTPEFTIIQTGMCSGFTGDAALYLKDTACRNIILFGSCGLAEEKDGFQIGSLVSPSKCFSYESFSSMLFKHKADVFYPDKTLFEKITHKNNEIKNVTCATVSSLKLEEDNLTYYKNKNIDVFDMECSALFSAGNHIGIKTAALFYVSDIVSSKPFYMNMEDASKLKISNSIKNAVNVLSRLF